MKRTLFAIVFLLIVVAPIPWAASPAATAMQAQPAGQRVTYAWDASVSPEVSGYALFIRDYTHGYNYDAPSWESDDAAVLTCTIELPSDRYSAAVVRAWAWGAYDLAGNRVRVWSGDSNEVVYMPEVPRPEGPGNFRRSDP